MIGQRQVGFVMLRASLERGKWDLVRIDPNLIYLGEDAIPVMREAFKSLAGLIPLATISLPTVILIFPIDSQIPIGLLGSDIVFCSAM